MGNDSVRLTFRGKFIFVWLIGVFVFCIILLAVKLFDGGFKASQVQFTEFYTCTGDEEHNPVSMIAWPTETVYICGNTEANGIVQGDLQLWYKGDIVISQLFSHPAGFFLEEVKHRKGFEPGYYTVDFYSARRVRAQTTFTVTTNVLP